MSGLLPLDRFSNSAKTSLPPRDHDATPLPGDGFLALATDSPAKGVRPASSGSSASFLLVNSEPPGPVEQLRQAAVNFWNGLAGDIIKQEVDNLGRIVENPMNLFCPFQDIQRFQQQAEEANEMWLRIFESPDPVEAYKQELGARWQRTGVPQLLEELKSNPQARINAAAYLAGLLAQAALFNRIIASAAPADNALRASFIGKAHTLTLDDIDTGIAELSRRGGLDRLRTQYGPERDALLRQLSRFDDPKARRLEDLLRSAPDGGSPLARPAVPQLPGVRPPAALPRPAQPTPAEADLLRKLDRFESAVAAGGVGDMSLGAVGDAINHLIDKGLIDQTRRDELQTAINTAARRRDAALQATQAPAAQAPAPQPPPTPTYGPRFVEDSLEIASRRYSNVDPQAMRQAILERMEREGLVRSQPYGAGRLDWIVTDRGAASQWLGRLLGVVIGDRTLPGNLDNPKSDLAQSLVARARELEGAASPQPAPQAPAPLPPAAATPAAPSGLDATLAEVARRGGRTLDVPGMAPGFVAASLPEPDGSQLVVIRMSDGATRAVGSSSEEQPRGDALDATTREFLSRRVEELGGSPLSGAPAPRPEPVLAPQSPIGLDQPSVEGPQRPAMQVARFVQDRLGGIDAGAISGIVAANPTALSDAQYQEVVRSMVQFGNMGAFDDLRAQLTSDPAGRYGSRIVSIFDNSLGNPLLYFERKGMIGQGETRQFKMYGNLNDLAGLTGRMIVDDSSTRSRATRRCGMRCGVPISSTSTPSASTKGTRSSIRPRRASSRPRPTRRAGRSRRRWAATAATSTPRGVRLSWTRSAGGWRISAF